MHVNIRFEYINLTDLLMERSGNYHNNSLYPDQDLHLNLSCFSHKRSSIKLPRYLLNDELSPLPTPLYSLQIIWARKKISNKMKEILLVFYLLKLVLSNRGQNLMNHSNNDYDKCVNTLNLLL